MRLIAIRLVVICVLAVQASCAPAPSRADAVGVYRANHDFGDDILEVKSDGSYHMKFVGNNGRVVENSGTWEFEPMDGRPRISFAKFVFGIPDMSSKPGYWNVELERSFGRLRFCIDEDRGLYYEKEP
jgi:hypothetical protein